ncbi:MAG: DNA alkylation response protein [Xanthomonadales bacterium]|nr:DNA alkylation response protein [Xanthomonadales bacterium]
MSLKNSDSEWLAETHCVENQPTPLENHNVYRLDAALLEGLEREGAAWAEPELQEFGRLTGRAEIIELGFQANESRPALHTHDRNGHRVNEVRFHPAYHELMRYSLGNGLHASHWTEPRAGAQVARAAKFYLMSQVEAAHGCPVTMTSAVIPALRHQADVYAEYAEKILSYEYDPRNVPIADKSSITMGMAMTEKQGGSDVRSNSTRAYPVGEPGPGQEYRLVGHKYFVSAPMCDAFLVLAQSEAGLSCFFMPRWRPDGTLNAMQIQKLKNKMGNVANASSEVELRGAYAVMVGEEGRGVRTIIDMVSMTRFDCMIGSSGGMRQAVVQAIHHSRQRAAFGKPLIEQTLMQNVLADLALESEAATALTLRIARALDEREGSAHERRLVRLGTVLGKYWICKRTPGHAFEAMECIGGSGVMEDSIMPRLFRESPVNAIWEGSGNVQCLDLLRALQKEPEVADVYFAELDRASGSNDFFDDAVIRLKNQMANPETLEFRSRSVLGSMAVMLQAALLIQYSTVEVATAFCASRLGDSNHSLYGTLPRGAECRAIIDRALPELA